MINIIKTIALVCQMGASGMGGAYNDASLIAHHQNKMVLNNLAIQKNCVRSLLSCVTNKRKSAIMSLELSEHLTSCILEESK